MMEPMFNEDGSLTVEMTYWQATVEAVRGMEPVPHDSVDAWVDWYLSQEDLT